MRILTNIDDRDNCPVGQKTGVYYVIKKVTIARFTFGKSSSSFETIDEAFAAMREFISKRTDANKLTVSLLNTHR